MYRRTLIMLLALIMAHVTANPMRPDTAAPASNQTSNATAPKVTAPKPPRVPRLDNILVIGELRKAFFDAGNEATVGDTVNGYLVTQIEPDFVVLQRGNARSTLELKTPGEFSVSSAKEE